jgi:hypothetical protein
VRAREGSASVGNTPTSPPLRTTGKQRGGITGKGFLPGRSGNAGGRPGGEALMRRCLRKSFEENEAQAMAALARRWGSTKHVQDMVELLAKLEGEMTKETGDGARGVQIILLNNRGAHPSTPKSSARPRGGRRWTRGSPTLTATLSDWLSR